MRTASESEGILCEVRRQPPGCSQAETLELCSGKIGHYADTKYKTGISAEHGCDFNDMRSLKSGQEERTMCVSMLKLFDVYALLQVFTLSSIGCYFLECFLFLICT